MSAVLPDDPTLESLRSKVAEDLAPVRPFRWASRLVAAIATVASAAILCLWMWLGPRDDIARLGGLGAWGLSLVQASCAGGVLALALSQSLPGRWASLGRMAGLGALGVAVHGWISAWTHTASPVWPSAGSELQLALFCLAAELALALPLLSWSLWLLRQGMPFRPALLGAVAGLGAGLVGDAVWRLFCPYSSPGHVLSSHSLPILLLAGAGALAGLLWDRWRQRRWRERRGERG